MVRSQLASAVQLLVLPAQQMDLCKQMGLWQHTPHSSPKAGALSRGAGSRLGCISKLLVSSTSDAQLSCPVPLEHNRSYHWHPHLGGRS